MRTMKRRERRAPVATNHSDLLQMFWGHAARSLRTNAWLNDGTPLELI